MPTSTPTPTFATFDARNIAINTMADLSIQLSDFAVFLGGALSLWQLQRALRGDRRLDHQEEERLTELCRDLRNLAAMFPIKLNWADHHAIITLLAKNSELARQLTTPNSKTPLPVIKSQPVSAELINAAVDQIHPDQ